MDLGAKIRDAIAGGGYRQIDFARKAGLSASRLSNYINGSRLPDFFTLCRMAEILGMSVADFNLAPAAEPDRTEYVVTVSGSRIVSVKKLRVVTE